MKKFFIPFLSLFLFISVSYGQILNVPEIEQEQDQWCWAGSSKCILDFYGYVYPQCEIADYARTVINWHDFGSVNCCVTPVTACNYWNYMYGDAGSIEDILYQFGYIDSYGVGNYLETNEVNNEFSNQRPFVIRWGWDTGGGHFVVGHGMENNSTFYYMDPWFGEGYKISNYDWVKVGGGHTWTHSLVLTTSPSSQPEIENQNNIKIYPNPTSDFINIDLNITNQIQNLEIYNLNGQVIYSENYNDKQIVQID